MPDEPMARQVAARMVADCLDTQTCTNIDGPKFYLNSDGSGCTENFERYIACMYGSRSDGGTKGRRSACSEI